MKSTETAFWAVSLLSSYTRDALIAQGRHRAAPVNRRRKPFAALIGKKTNRRTTFGRSFFGGYVTRPEGVHATAAILKRYSPCLRIEEARLRFVSGSSRIAEATQRMTSQMRKNFLTLSIGSAMLAALNLPAQASPSCLKQKEPFALSADTMKWSMTIAPGAECIQGLRWSYMQIFEVSVVSGPSKGRLVMVGSGFRYYANSNDQGVDKFTLLISGKNRHDLGKSTLEVEVYSNSGEANTNSRKRVASTHAAAPESE